MRKNLNHFKAKRAKLNLLVLIKLSPSVLYSAKMSFYIKCKLDLT